jgi:hypothetical protein
MEQADQANQVMPFFPKKQFCHRFIGQKYDRANEVGWGERSI